MTMTLTDEATGTEIIHVLDTRRPNNPANLG